MEQEYLKTLPSFCAKHCHQILSFAQRMGWKANQHYFIFPHLWEVKPEFRMRCFWNIESKPCVRQAWDRSKLRVSRTQCVRVGDRAFLERDLHIDVKTLEASHPLVELSKGLTLHCLLVDLPPATTASPCQATTVCQWQTGDFERGAKGSWGGDKIVDVLVGHVMKWV